MLTTNWMGLASGESPKTFWPADGCAALGLLPARCASVGQLFLFMFSTRVAPCGTCAHRALRAHPPDFLIGFVPCGPKLHPMNALYIQDKEEDNDRIGAESR